MERLLAQAGNDPKIGVIVLTGTGERAFCVGGDVNWEKGDSSGKSGLQDLEFNFNRQIAECPEARDRARQRLRDWRRSPHCLFL